MTERTPEYRTARTDANRQLAKLRREQWELTLLDQIHLAGLPEPERQGKGGKGRWHPSQPWKADFIYHAERILIEVQGGVWTRGRHVRGKGYIEDCTKLNEAVLLGWRVFWFTPEHIKDGSAIQYLALALGETGVAIP